MFGMITDRDTNKVYFSPFLKECSPRLWECFHGMEQEGLAMPLPTFSKYIWCRDYMPIQVGERDFVGYRFSPDYLRNDRRYRRFVCDGQSLMQGYMQKDYMRHIDLVVDGGNVVKCGDTVVMTEKVFYENADKSRAVVERLLRDAFRCDLLFLPWDREEVFGHSDGIVHYADGDRVLMTNYEDFSPRMAREISRRLEKRFDVVHLRYRSKRKHMRSWAYINFLQVGQHIFVPQLDAEEDEQAIEQIGAVFPDSKMVELPALDAVRRGGALNCLTWNVKEDPMSPLFST